ncbi:MAG: CDP-alcohol phosphatidyltransferase family protein [Candidatus Aenigmarchaeota archaeon]|nr:CDP-alcohol phosphatidyltransferase family protein [Candidatus Aenigmarchaeota archaeon]
MIKSGRRKPFSSIERVVGGVFSSIPVTPNQWTFMSLAFGAAGLATSATHRGFGLSLTLFFAAFLLDYVDGAVARYTGNITKAGAYIDGISDRFVEAFILTGLMFYSLPSVFVDPKISLAVLLFLGTMTSYSRAYADHRKIVTNERKLREMGGLLERFERISILLAAMALSFYYGPAVISYTVILLIVLSFVTVAQRILYSVREACR